MSCLDSIKRLEKWKNIAGNLRSQSNIDDILRDSGLVQVEKL